VRGPRIFVVPAAVVLVTATACSASHSSVPEKVHAKTVAQQAQTAIDSVRQMSPLAVAATACVTGILDDIRDAEVSDALDEVFPGGGPGDAYAALSIDGDEVTMQRDFNGGQVTTGTFDLGRLIYDLIATLGEKATAGTPLQIQFELFGLIGPAAIDCAEAAWWLDGTVGGQIGTALQKKFLTLSIGQQLLASRGSAITGTWVLYRKLENCSVAGSNGCQLNQMDVTIACTGTGCTIIRTNGASPVFKPWDHSIPIAFDQSGWQASGTEKWAAQCDKVAIPGTGVDLALKVTSGKVLDGVWRAQGLQGTYTVRNVATSCFPAGSSVEEVSTTKFTG
jgi:hypothetical protein